MNAKLSHRITETGRDDLCKIIPMDTPIHMFIDPSAACNFSCQFCFNQDKSKTHHEIMSMDTFRKIVHDLKQFPHPLKMIALYAFGEPLMNRNLPEMVAMLKQAHVTEKISMTTNGWWLYPETSDKLVAAGIDRIIISVNGLSSEQYQNITGARVNFKQYVDNIRHLYENRGHCLVHIKSTNATIQGKEDLYFKTFGDICDEISVENIAPLWPGIQSDARPTKNVYTNPLVPVDICPYIFYHMTVQANGQVSACFLDWDRQLVIGDTRTDSLVDIWNGQQLKHIRLTHLNKQRASCGICKDCGQLQYGQADNIERCREQIMEKPK